MKLKTKLFFLLLLGHQLSTVAQSKGNGSANQNVKRPKLVVGIVVDQMRWDYLYRFQDRYGKGGFNRMFNEGFTCDNTNIDYIPTITAAGHASVYTGSVPAIHGIAGNDFIIRATGKNMYCTGDSTEVTVGSTTNAGNMSPRNLLSSTITDELSLATNFRSKVIGIALKDRGAILPAGHTANAAYWFDDTTNKWISSTYYMKALPEWVNQFNALQKQTKYLNQNWNTLYPIETYIQSDKDNSKHEGAFKGMDAPVFPIPTAQLSATNKGIIRSTPYGNSLTLDFAKETVSQEKMGSHAVTDFLTVSLSSTDYVGHQFGPNSIEIEDIYLRLDQDLDAFFLYLDKQVGKGNYTVFLTADHAAAHNAGFLQEHKIPAGNWNADQYQKELSGLLEKQYGQKNLIAGFHNFQVNLNLPLIARAKLKEDDIINTCITYLKDLPGVVYALDIKKSNDEVMPAGLKSRIANGYNRQRSGSVQIVLQPGWYFGSSTTGTTHGTWYPYDTHIPLVFMGWGVNQGKLQRPTHMTDIAATVAAILQIQAPNGSIGQPITELIKL